MRRFLAWVFLLALLPAFAGRVAIPQFGVLENRGLVPLAKAESQDLARLARLLPAALTTRLVQSGREVELLDVFVDEAGVADLLKAGYDEVLLGSVTRLEGSVVVSLRRYRLREGKAVLAGAAAVPVRGVSEALTAADQLLERVYAPGEGIFPAQITHVLVVPSTFRIPLGGVRTLKVMALDAQGRVIPGVRFVYQVENPSVARVSEDGTVVGVGPGDTKIQVQAVGFPGAGQVRGEATLTVAPPAFGLRFSGIVAGDRGPFPSWLRIGIRLSSASGFTGFGTVLTAKDVTQAPDNPLGYLASFFAGVVTGGQLTASLDFDLGNTLLFHLEAYQRNNRSYFGAGLGFATPTAPSGVQGVSLRLVLGSYLLGTTFPIEASGEAIFPTAGGGSPTLRLVVGLGLDLYP